MEHDFIIIGAGLVGLSTAFHIKKNLPDAKVLILEKENDICKHQSGNNSGVIHSGIYYKPNSLKAQNCVQGYEKLLSFAKEHDIPHDICGKVIVATEKSELPVLERIYQRGLQNGLQNLAKISKDQLREIEPHCNGVAGISVPQTGIIDYIGLGRKLKELYIELGGEIIFNTTVKKITNKGNFNVLQSDKEEFVCKKLISCAGLYSDKVSKMTDSKNDLRIIPFRGEYYKLKENKKYLVKNLIYPVPDENFPFLGVHFTRMINGEIEAGPNAVLSFKREGYKFTDFSFSDTVETFSWPGFWKIAAKYGQTGIGEIYRSLSKKAFTKALQKLIPEIVESDLEEGGAGVRAQACNREGALIDDFDILKNNNIVHVRNAPSPAATSCLSIGEKISNLF